MAEPHQEPDSVSRETALALIEDAKHWSRAYTDARDELRRLEEQLEAAQEALRQAAVGFLEAYEYGCNWPIGLDTDPQEQRGMDRDTFIRNMELYGERAAGAASNPAKSPPWQDMPPSSLATLRGPLPPPPDEA